MNPIKEAILVGAMFGLAIIAMKYIEPINAKAEPNGAWAIPFALGAIVIYAGESVLSLLLKDKRILGALRKFEKRQ